MPTSTFYRLEESKRKRIIDAIVKECSNVPFEEVSINRIIKDAEISRGSFYQYFEDKHDMFNYLMEDIIQVFHELDVRFLKTDASVSEVLLELYDFILQRCLYHPNASMYQNLVKNFKIRYCLSHISSEQLQKRYVLLKEKFQLAFSEEQLIGCIQIIRIIFYNAVLEVLTDPTDLIKKRQDFCQQLEVLSMIGGNTNVKVEC